MGDTNDRSRRGLRRAFKLLNKLMLLMWRLGLGTWGNRREISGQIMVVVHTGRKTGLRRLTPLNYAIHNGEIYCLSGFGKDADWYRNIEKMPEVEIWLPDGRWSGRSIDVTDHPQTPELMRLVLIASGFAAYLAGINPQRISQEALEELLDTYRLIHIQRGEALTGPGGPGDLAWFWPVATLVLGILLMRRRNVHSSGSRGSA